MKYIIVLGDGMADFPLEKLGNKTPLQFASKPNIDYIASHGIMGISSNIPEGMLPGSDTANLSVLGYDPVRYYSGRSPFEAAGMGISMDLGDISFRCNLVTLSNEEKYEEKIMIDYSAGEISSGESAELIESIKKSFANEYLNFYNGMSYRHLMIWQGAPFDWVLTPPHDIMDKNISEYLPKGEKSDFIIKLMRESNEILSNHEVNKERLLRGLNPANSIWLWGEGKKPELTSFKEKYGLKGAVITAVDLIKGIGGFAGMNYIAVEGATGNIDTNYKGKAEAAVSALKNGFDFVFLHIEAPDECSHQNDLENKIKSIENIDNLVIKTIIEDMKKEGMEYRLMFLSDHYTPVSLRTHTSDAVPFLIYDNTINNLSDGRDLIYSEMTASESGLYFPEGYKLMDYFIKKVTA